LRNSHLTLVRAHVLEVYVTDSSHPLLQNRHRVLAAEDQVTAVVEQAHQSRIGLLHQAVDFAAGLHPGSHMVMVGELHSHLLGFPAELVQPLGQKLPLCLGVDRLRIEHR